MAGTGRSTQPSNPPPSVTLGIAAINGLFTLFPLINERAARKGSRAARSRVGQNCGRDSPCTASMSSSTLTVVPIAATPARTIAL